MNFRSFRSSRIVAARLFTAAAAIALAGALLGGALAPRGDAAATISAELVRDIVPGSDGSDLSDLTAVGATLFFRATDSDHGAELWKSDGSAAGTVLVKDIYPGSGYSSPSNFASVGSTLYFNATDGINGIELWKSDGTAAGTVMVKDINPGVGNSSPSGITAFNGSLYFSANDGTKGIELWKSDGVPVTSGGTTERVTDINTGGDSYHGGLTVFNGSLYFRASDGAAHGVELWKSDGVPVTSGGTTEMVKDINLGAGNSNPGGITVFNGSLYFSANDGASGDELWKSDGVPVTSGGTTVMVKDINDTGGSSPYGFTPIGTSLYFVATDGSSVGKHGTELWKTDGTDTSMVKDINTGTAEGDPSGLIVFNGSLYFRANDGTNGIELWKSDGTAAGTVLVKDINPNAGISLPIGLTVFGGSFYFQATDGSHGSELWKSDGTADGTVQVADINAGSGSSQPSELTPIGTSLYFRATDTTHGTELWKAGDFSPPETQIDSGPSGTITTASTSFSFSADEAATFQCALDGAAMSACTSPKAFASLTNGSHSFRVQATDLVGNVDASPAERAFTVNVSTPPLTQPKTVSYPQTRITKHPKRVVRTKTTKAKASFAFRSSKKGSRFSCKLDKGKWKSCRSPKAYKVKPGKHTFQVRATYAGHTDRTPAKWTWTVKRG